MALGVAMGVVDPRARNPTRRPPNAAVRSGRRPMGSALVPAAAPTVHPPGPVASGHMRLASLAPRSIHASAPARRGKAPPVNEFSGEDPECLLEDWLLSLERVSLWNAWSEEEQMIQLAGHLKGRALQECPGAKVRVIARNFAKLRRIYA